MKIESRRVLHFAGQTGAALTRAILATSRVRETFEDPAWDPKLRNRNYILSCWHENLLVGAWWCGRYRSFHTIASQSKDGEIIAGCASSFGMDIIRGSSSQGGALALRQVVTASKTRKLFRCAVTPDGPRGPRREMKSGVVYIASRLNLPIVCLGIACNNGWRLRSWDRLLIPKPFQVVQICLSAPVWPSSELARNGVDDFAAFVQHEMDRVQSRAEEQLLGAHTDSRAERVNRAA